MVAYLTWIMVRRAKRRHIFLALQEKGHDRAGDGI